MRKIEKKAWPELFKKVASGEKTFDVRLDRFKCESGDTLILREWDPKTKKYTGRSLEKKVTFVLKSKNLVKFWTRADIEKYGFQVIALKDN